MAKETSEVLVRSLPFSGKSDEWDAWSDKFLLPKRRAMSRHRTREMFSPPARMSRWMKTSLLTSWPRRSKP
jgi:hypothetical protein